MTGASGIIRDSGGKNNGRQARVSDGRLHVQGVLGGGTQTIDADSVVDAGNSTTTPLAGGGNFTGAGVDLLKFRSVSIMLLSDKDSVADGMKFEFSTDNVNWDDSYSFTFTGNDARRFQFPATGKFFRVNYTNVAGAPNAQTFFRVQTILHPFNILTSIHRLQDNTEKDRSSQIVKAALMAQINGTGDFVNIQSSGGGVLKVDTGNSLTNPFFVLSAMEPFPLSEAIDGRPIALTGSGFVDLHIVPVTKRDVITIYASNLDTIDHKLLLRIGGTAADLMTFFLPALETVVALHEIPLDDGVTVDGDISFIGGPVHVVGRVGRRGV